MVQPAQAPPDGARTYPSVDRGDFSHKADVHLLWRDERA